MIIYCDGSTNELTQQQHIDKFGSDVASLSWGIKIEHGHHPIEIMGQRFLPKRYRGAHEHFAFVEAVVYAMSHNGNTLNTTIYTDYQNITDMAWPVMMKNPHALPKNIKRHFDDIRDFYSKDVMYMVEQFLIFGQIKWVKGHSNCLNNLRVDYLARSAFKIAVGTINQIEEFDVWMQRRIACNAMRKDGKCMIGGAFLK